MSDYLASKSVICEVEKLFIDDQLSQSLISVSQNNDDALKAEFNMIMSEILELQKYDSVPTNIENPIPISLSYQMKLEEQHGQPLTFAQV